MNKKLKKELDQLIEKYGFDKIKDYKYKYDIALDLYANGTEVEDKQGLEIAQMEYYEDADKIMEEIPEDYKAFREKLDRWYD